MKFNGKFLKSRGFIVMSLTLMLVLVGTINYNLSKQSLLETSQELQQYEEALNIGEDEKDTKKDTKKEEAKKEDTKVVDSKVTKVDEKVKETSAAIEKQITSKKNLKKASYIVDMKMNREKQRAELVASLNEIVNNPSTNDNTREQASTMKLQLVKDQELELKIEDLLSAKGFSEPLVYISNGTANIVVNEEKLEKADAAKVFDLVAAEAKMEYDNIKLMNNNAK
jgi:stage III sporulation protein AH